MKSVTLIFPHQLFESNPSLNNQREVFIVEEYLFFKQYKFHKQKLVFQRAAMKFYKDYLISKNFRVNYIESTDELSDVRKLIQYLHEHGVIEIHYVDLVDNWFEKRLKNYSHNFGIKLFEYSSPGFLNSKLDIQDYFKGKEKFFQTDFYIKQRKKLNLLINPDGSPFGGKWSFDSENRLKYPNKKSPPRVCFPKINKYYEESISYVEKNFPDNYGEINLKFIYPTTFEESKLWLKQFLENRFNDFGYYEDAIVAEENILNHSVLSPILNIGLLTPQYVLMETIKFVEQNPTPLNSFEGFIRQIVGWREFIRGVYEIAGSYQRTKNFFGFNKKLPKFFYNGSTGIMPLDLTIKKVLKTGYCHHIERLMVLGNFMLLCEFDPDDIFKWFSELFIDAYDWVMVPNVYGMSQFADGGLISTKPYISSSNYLMKMSNYKKGEWQNIWDGLFWRFIDKHRSYFVSNPRMSVLVKNFEKMDLSRKKMLLKAAKDFLKGLELDS